MLDSVSQQAEPAGVTPQDAPSPPPDRANFVKEKLKLVADSKKHFAKPYKRMGQDQDFAYKGGVGFQWPGQTEEETRYIANIVQRHVNTRVAALYAKNPTVKAKPKRRKEFRIWDGQMASVQNAQLALQSAGMSMMPPPQWALDLLTDIQQGMLRKEMIKNVGETLEILFTYFMKEQLPDFKEQMKQLVRRTETCGIGWVKLGYQRLYAPRPSTAARIADVVDQMQTIDRMRKDVIDGKVTETDADYEDLKLALAELEKEPEIIVREGLVWDFPQSTRIWLDKRTKNIQGFVGTTWLAEEFTMSCDDIKEVFGKDVRAAVNTAAQQDMIYGRADTGAVDPDANKVYCFYDRKTGLKYWLCENYPDVLEEPSAPDVSVEQFFPYYPLIFNAVEHDEEIFPPSDVRLLRSQQIEYNRIKEALRQHRIANRPLYVTPSGALEDEDLEGDGHMALDNYPAHAVLKLNGLKDGENVGNKLQPVQKVNIDPNVYESEGTFSDMERVTGSQEANLGGTSGATATESSISEGSRLSSLDCNRDDLDTLLTKMARDGGQTLLLQCSLESVEEIVGPGAAWPELTRTQVAKELFLDVEGGSSGRPNRALDVQNFKEIGPLLLQIPGISAERLAQKGIKILDDSADMADYIDPGALSIVAQNGAVQPSTGDPMTDPNAQGMQGASNAPAPALPPPRQGPPSAPTAPR